MTINISGFGLIANVVASNTFPVGFTVTQFADDTDALDIPSLPIADTAMGLNGDLITWAKASPIKVTLSVIPGSEDDVNLAILLKSNRVGRGKISSNDTINLSLLYPDGTYQNLIDGVITEGMPGISVSNSGRSKTNTYIFSFENEIGGEGQ